MEEIIKMEIAFTGRYLSMENLYRALVVLAGIVLLCLCVENQSVRYHRYAETDSERTRQCVYAGGIHTENGELYAGTAKEIDLRGGGSNLYNLKLDIAGYINAGDITDGIAEKIDDAKDMGIKADDNVAAGYKKETDSTKGSLLINVPGEENSAGDNAAVISPEIKEPAEEKPIEIRVTAYGNGGMPKVSENTYKAADFTAEILEIPKRPGKMFTGWYEDAEGSIPFDGVGENTEFLNLYAGWSEFPGFVSNDSGHITACIGGEEAVLGGLLVLPCHESCVGVERGAFDGLADEITDVYIPGNITYIEPGTFDVLIHLMYIQVDDSNPVYFSEKGILYDRNGDVAAYPAGRDITG